MIIDLNIVVGDHKLCTQSRQKRQNAPQTELTTDPVQNVVDFCEFFVCF